MGYCNLLNYVYILVKEKKLENKTHAHHTYLRMAALAEHRALLGDVS
jgi:hypothetical protein